MSDSSSAVDLSKRLPQLRIALQLADREWKKLLKRKDDLSSKEIAGTLNISARTVDAHRGDIMTALNLHSVAELTKFAVRAGITPLEV